MKYKMTNWIVGMTIFGMLVAGAWLAPTRADVQTEKLNASLLAKLTSSDSPHAPKFGSSTALEGDTVVVGAYYAYESTGAVYIYYRNQGGPDTWGEVKKITADDAATYSAFGVSVALDHDILVVGASQAEIGANYDQGAVYIFERNAGGTDAWGQVKKITPDDGDFHDQFGNTVAINGNVLAVGAAYADINGNPDQGAVYIFYRDQGGLNNWGQVLKIVASDGGASNYFSRVAFYGDMLVVGAYGNNSEQGAAYVFYKTKNGSDAWGEVKKLTASDGLANDRFGSGVAIFGDTIVLGAPMANVKYSDQGAAYVFQRDIGGPDQWGEAKKIIPLDGFQRDFFGEALSLENDTLLVGAEQADVQGFLDSGTAYVFMRNEWGQDIWGQSAKIYLQNWTNFGGFGASVQLEGDTVLIGAPQADLYKGASYIYDLEEANLAYLPVVIFPCLQLYADDFSNPASGWPIGNSLESKSEYNGGEYRMLVRKTYWGLLVRPGFTAEDFSVSVDLRNINDVYSSYGILFGIAPDWSSFYSLEIYPDGWFGIYRYDPSTYATIAESFHPAILQGKASNHIKIERSGSSIKAYANGQLLATVTDGNYLGPRGLGLAAFTYNSGNADIRFDNYQVYSKGCTGVNAPEGEAGERQAPALREFDNHEARGKHKPIP